MKHYICGAICGGIAAAALWLSGGNALWQGPFSSSSSIGGEDTPNAPHAGTQNNPGSHDPVSTPSTSLSSQTTPASEPELSQAPNHPFTEIAAGPAADPTTQLGPQVALACMGTAFGASCLSGNGNWTLYTPETSQLSAADIIDVAVCSNGGVVFAHAAGIDILRGESWTAISVATWGTDSPVTLVECLPDGSIWVGYEEGLSQFDGSDWVHFERSELGASATGPVDMVGDTSNTIWVIMPESIAQFDGRNWTTYSPGSGLPDQETGLSGIAIGDNGLPRARDGKFNRSLQFTGEQWVVRDVDHPAGFTGFAIDARDSEWVGSAQEGAWVYSPGGAVIQDRDSSDLSSNQVLAIATDDSGRTWLGTSWGLNVFDGRDWTVYHMHTAELPDNRIVAIDVAGEGPRLPDLDSKPTGTLVGNLVQAGEPFTDTLVEVCVNAFGGVKRGPSPCISEAEFHTAITDIDGRFTFSELPTGRYTLAFLEDGEWTQMEAQLFDDPLFRIFVLPGETTNIGSLEIAR